MRVYYVVVNGKIESEHFSKSEAAEHAAWVVCTSPKGTRVTVEKD